MFKKFSAALLVMVLLFAAALPVRAEEPCMLLVTRVYTDPVTGAVMLEGAAGNVDITNNAGAVFTGFDLTSLLTLRVAENAVIWLPDNLSAPSAQRCVAVSELPGWYAAAGSFLNAMGVREAFFAAVTLENAASVTMLTLCTFD